MMPEAPVQVAAGIITRNGRYLIARRKTGAHLGGLWEFPGGKREAGESLEECLRREAREELGIEITAPVFLRSLRHDYPEKSVELYFFKCEVKAGEAKAIGCDDLRWVTPAELSAFEFPPADRLLVRSLQNHG
jgi:8-oxo-dGTP diphosphatase